MLQLVGGYWTDDHNNRWNSDFWTEEAAERVRKTLVNCDNCENCVDCQHCQDCLHCQDCRDCQRCRGLLSCQDCCGCQNCRGCRRCLNCWNCKEYITNPQQYRTAKIGSRNEQTIFYYGQTEIGMSLQVVCGYFCGDLEAFETAVRRKHGSNVYAQQYKKEIDKVRVLFGLEGEK